MKRREQEHYREINSFPKSRWLQKLLVNSYKPIMIRLAQVPKDIWKDVEIDLIAYYHSIQGEGVDILYC